MTIGGKTMNNLTLFLIGCVLLATGFFLFSSIQIDKPELSLLEQQYKTTQKSQHHNIIRNIEEDLLLLDMWNKDSITAIKNKHNASLAEMNAALLNVNNFKMYTNKE